MLPLYYNGIKIIERKGMEYTESYQYKFPKTKKRRIRKKWAKNKKYYKDRLVHYGLLVGDDEFYCDPELLFGGGLNFIRVYRMDKPDFYFDFPYFKMPDLEPEYKKSSWLSSSYFYSQSILRKPDSGVLLTNVVA